MSIDKALVKARWPGPNPLDPKPGGKCPGCGEALYLGNFTCDLQGTCDKCGQKWEAKRVVQWRTRAIEKRDL